MPSSGSLASVSVDMTDVARRLEQMAKAGLDLSPVMAVVAEQLVADVHDKFDQEGPGWAPLAPSTLASRRGTTAQILQDTGRFAGSIHGTSGSDYAEASTDVGYAIYHVTGTAKMPRRDPFDLDDSRIEAAVETIATYMLAHMGGS